MKRQLLVICLALCQAGAFAGVASSACGVYPALVGDGVADDTQAIQARLDGGGSCVYLPPPEKEYLISRALRIGSNQELRLDRFTRVRLAPKSDCPMLENRCYVVGRNVNVAVTGGVWDMDNLRQRPNSMQVRELRPLIPKVHSPGFFWGMAMRFCHVDGLTETGANKKKVRHEI